MLQEADYSMTENAFSSQGRFKGDENLLVKFFKNPRFNQAKSQEAGRPIYDEVDFIQIMQPGNKDSIIIQPATQMDKQRFSAHWARYEARTSQDVYEGTPLTEWPGVTRSMAEELKFFNVHTVEQLASVSDSNGIKIMGINLLKDKAKAFLEVSKENAGAETLVAANAKIGELTDLVAEMGARLAALEE